MDRVRVDSFDDALALALGRAQAYLDTADSALRSAHAELAALGDGLCGAVLPQRYCEDASERLGKVRRILLQALQEKRFQEGRR
jgi:hypothetical protein